MEIKKIYIAGKLNAMAVDYLHNVHKMMEVAEVVKKHGSGKYSIFVPAIDLLMGIKFGYNKYEDYFNNNLGWLEASDAIYLVDGWYTSSGTKKEIERALEKGIPVFDSLLGMDKWFEEGDNSLAIVGTTHEANGEVCGVVRNKDIE